MYLAIGMGWVDVRCPFLTGHLGGGKTVVVR